MKIYKTDNGLRRADFRDRNDEPCSIQESSVDTDFLLWLGRDLGAGCRMHVDQKQAHELANLILTFATRGELPDKSDQSFQLMHVDDPADRSESDSIIRSWPDENWPVYRSAGFFRGVYL